MSVLTEAEPDRSVRTFSNADQRALVAVAMQFFLNGAVFASFMPRLPEIRGRIGVSTGGLGAMLSVAGVIGIAGSVLVGPAVERLGTRRVVMLSGTILGSALPLIGIANGKAVFLSAKECSARIPSRSSLIRSAARAAVSPVTKRVGCLCL
jgi:predicted MFS family arabinose efflux permease